MKKFIDKHIVFIHYILLIIMGLIMAWYIARGDYALSVDGDFFEQNIAFRHYFRELFYDTKKFFPNLALHIGGGQNIYYFAYYGLFNPFTILSYFFPFISAGSFLMILGILNITLTPILFYNFLKKNNYSNSLCFLGALFLLSSDSFIAHNFRHIMFIHYMPFLIMGLFGTKKYLDENKSFLLILSVFLIIITSYYFSIPAIICLCLYALYYDMKKGKNFKTLFEDAYKFLGRIILGIVASSFLLLPIIYTLKDGRGSILYSVSLSDFLPNLNLLNLVRSQYGVGLTLITLFAAVYNILFVKKENKVLAIILLVLTSVPIFSVVLNGFLYDSGKVFIPLIFLFIILILDMLNNLTYAKKRNIVIALFITLPLALLSKGVATDKIMFDLLLTFVICLIYSKYPKCLIIMPVIALSFHHIFLNYKNQYFLLSKEEYDTRYNIINADMSEYINNNTDSLYRYQNNFRKFLNMSNATSQYLPTVYSSTQNRSYQDMFYNSFNNYHQYDSSIVLFYQNNLFFQKFMGVRYYLSKYEPTYGYKKIAEFNGETLYENDNVYSIGFAMSNILNYKTYYSLPYMEKPQAFINNIIIDGTSSNPNLEFNYEKIDLKYEVKEAHGINYDSENQLITTEGDAKVVLKLQEPIRNKNLAIRFKVENKTQRRMYIKINDVINRTAKVGKTFYVVFNQNNIFEYVLSGNEDIEELVINFERGSFQISDVEFYTIDKEFFDQNNTTPLNIDFEKTKGDVIKGSINVLENGYFIFTIPYDNGYTIKVDNKKVNIEKVNEGFIGFKIDKGYHEIALTYRAPLSRLGQVISILSIGGIVIILFLENKHNKKNIKK